MGTSSARFDTDTTHINLQVAHMNVLCLCEHTTFHLQRCMCIPGKASCADMPSTLHKPLLFSLCQLHGNDNTIVENVACRVGMNKTTHRQLLADLSPVLSQFEGQQRSLLV